MEGDFKATPDKAKCSGCDFRSICSQKGFTVGVNFKQVQSSKKKGTMRVTDDAAETVTGMPATHEGTSKTFVSERTKKRAIQLAENNVIQNDDKIFQVRSGSDPNKTYRVTENRCECQGYRNYSVRHPDSEPTCSHLEAVKIFKEKNRS